ncbi:MAG: anthranilate phosphoribosyltransferase [bacterium]|nr:anthranilate phosphoribosyltransferase [bacterium]
MKVKNALKAVVAGEPLQRGSMCEIIESLLRGSADPIAVGGLLMALAARGESLEELVGAAQAMRANMVPFEHDSQDAVDTCGTGGSGMDTFNISTAAALVAASAGARVIKHGNRAASSQCGSADLLESLGIPLELDPVAARTVFEEVGITFLYAPRYHPAMRHVSPIRRALGVRTLFNLLGPLCNPGRVDRQVIGVSKAGHVPLLARVLEELGTKRALVVHGAEGVDELTLNPGNRVRSLGFLGEREWGAQTLGLEPIPITTCTGGNAEQNRSLFLDLLDGKPTPIKDFVLLNAAAALVVSGKAQTPEAGLEQAREALESGASKLKLAAWIQVAQGVSDQ